MKLQEFSMMKFKLFMIFVLSVMSLNAKTTLDAETIARKIADDIIAESTWRFINHKTKEIYTDTTQIPAGIDVRIEKRYNNWLYSNGIINMAMIELGQLLNEPKYIDFARKNIRFAFDNYQWFERNQTDMTYWVFPFGMFYTMDALDCCGAEGSSVIELYQIDPLPEYEKYIEKAGDYIMHKELRLKDGTFARTSPANLTVWADDLYMGLSFLSRYAQLKNSKKVFNEAAKQVINFRKYLYSPKKELYYHGYYADIKEPNAANWGRANGWVMMAQANLLDRLPENHPKRKELLNIFQEQVLGVSRYQTESGMWRQLLDKPDSYLETSSTCMFTYSIARGIRKGFLDRRYLSIAEMGWEGLKTRINEDWKIESICRGTSMRNDLTFYYKRPQVLHDIHGMGNFLLAAIEMIYLEQEKTE